MAAEAEALRESIQPQAPDDEDKINPYASYCFFEKAPVSGCRCA